MGLETIQRKENEIGKHIFNGYNEYKNFEGKKYTGMRVGGTHQWYYDKGEWKEKKITPDKQTTSMEGLKYKLTHDRAEKGNGAQQIISKKSDSYKYLKG